jgi:hypothetical protein
MQMPCALPIEHDFEGTCFQSTCLIIPNIAPTFRTCNAISTKSPLELGILDSLQWTPEIKFKILSLVHGLLTRLMRSRHYFTFPLSNLRKLNLKPRETGLVLPSPLLWMESIAILSTEQEALTPSPNLSP